MADNGDKERAKASKDALNSVEAFIKKSKEANQTVQEMNSAFGNIATQLFGISGAAFFKEIPKTAAELKKANDEVVKFKRQLDEAFKGLGKDLKSEFGEVFDALEAGPKAFDSKPFDAAFDKLIKDSGVSVKSFTNLEDLEKQMAKHFEGHADDFDKFKKLKEEFNASEKKVHDDNEKFYDDILDANGKFLADLTDQERKQKLMQIHQAGFNNLVNEGNDLIKDMALYSEITDDSIAQSAVDANALKDGLAGAEQESKNLSKSSFSFGQGIKDATKNLASGIIPKMLEFDQAISDAGKNFGFVDMKSSRTSNNMAELGQSAARFNMSMTDAVALMGNLGDELSTINADYLAGAVEHFAAIEKATGISSGEISTIAGEMMRAGKSAEEVEQYMEGSNKMAKLFGVNTKKVLQGVARNIDKMRQMGFQGGEESLTRMVATAERLRMNVDEIFDVAAKARTIEGAMDMASQLQLAGGSFAAINPMDLLSAARKGPEELQNILKEMGDDIGTFSEDGTFSFDAVDVDRLQIVADATGQSMDSIQKMIQKNAEDNKKMDFMPDMQLEEVMGPDGKPLDQDMMNNMLLDSVDINGKALEGGMLDEMGIASLEDLTADQAQQLIQKKMDDQATLAEQAEANQSFQDSITAFKDAIFNLFTVFEPLIKILTSFIQTINGMPGPIKALVAALIGFAIIAPKLGMAMEGFKAMAAGGKGLFGKVKNMFSGKGKVETEGGTDISGSGSTDKAPGGKGETGLERLAKGLKAMGTDFGTVMKGVLATAVAGPALLLLLPGIPTLLLLAVVGALGELVVKGFDAISRGFGTLGDNFANVAKGALAMIIVGASLIPFAFALQMMSDVGWGTVLMALVMMTAGVIALMVIGALVSGPAGAMLLMGALALVLVGIALMAFGASMLIFAMASEKMQGLEFGWLSDLGWNLLLAAPGLVLGGLALGMASPFLLFGAIGIMAIAMAAQAAAAVDWSSFAAMGDALLAVVPGLIGFGFAGLMFFNPILMLGMLAMIGTLGALAVILAPLADSLPAAADGLDRMSDGLERLMSAANSLDLDKLDMLRSLSWSMAIGAVGGGLMGDSIGKIAEALAKLSKVGEGGGKGGTQKIQIDLKLNGRDLQSIIVDDTKIVS
jgi:hypothetical protein